MVIIILLSMFSSFKNIYIDEVSKILEIVVEERSEYQQFIVHLTLFVSTLIII